MSTKKTKWTEKKREAALIAMYTKFRESYPYNQRSKYDKTLLVRSTPDEFLMYMRLFYNHQFEIQTIVKWMNTNARAREEIKGADIERLKAMLDAWVVTGV